MVLNLMYKERRSEMRPPIHIVICSDGSKPAEAQQVMLDVPLSKDDREVLVGMLDPEESSGTSWLDDCSQVTEELADKILRGYSTLLTEDDMGDLRQELGEELYEIITKGLKMAVVYVRSVDSVKFSVENRVACQLIRDPDSRVDGDPGRGPTDAGEK
jgi:hypothetical protein